MKFQKKIIGVYMLFSVIVSVIFGSVLLLSGIMRYKDREYAHLQTLSDIKIEQMEGTLEGMESVIRYFLSDVEMLNALQEFARLEVDTYEELYYNEAASAIREKLSTYYLIDEYYRVIIFNKTGNVLSNTDYGDTILDREASYITYPWIGDVSGRGGENKILGLHKDDWGRNKEQQVLSIVKEIQGMDMGYIEVQQSKETLDSLLAEEERSISYFFMTKDGEGLYTNNPAVNANEIYEQMKESDGGINRVQINDKTFLCLKEELDAEDIVLLTVTDVNIMKEAMKEALPVSLVILIGALTISLGYVYLTSRQLTRPIRQLQHFMEMTRLDNMRAEIPEKISNDEIEALYVSYRDVLERLNKSMLNEKRMSLLQLQAQFDLLQAQVNPHFIYNVLNVISNRGMLSDDEIICDICGELAGMLRYATNTKEKYATVREEIQYMERYLHLLKYRYDHKMEYSIHIEQELYEEILPKIVLQQIVENAVIHGYEKLQARMEITVSGYKDDSGWYVKVHDSGAGISSDKQKELEEAIISVRKKLTKDRSNVELEIGGMGILNTYARLYLLYNEQLIFSISSNGEGTDVTIGAKKEEEYV